ncbi:MAG: peptide ABC transporter substrate-binding protein [Clostridiales bacterium]|jgi:peptide/nickel transport system substrate-binding protein|nr:peptide ABC transporter substrate-binding protein [Clostridiales bacterium]
MRRLLLTAAALGMLTGCFNLNNRDNSTPPPSAGVALSSTPTPIAPVNGGTLKIPIRPPKTLNPLLNEDASVDAVLKLLFEPLMTQDSAFKPVPNLASFNFASDGMSVIITLRDGLKWSDGVTITSDDVVFSLNTLRDAPDTVVYKSCIRNISAAYTILDEKKIKLQFLQPYSGMAYAFCFPIIPKHYYENQTEPSDDINMKPIGNGLFVFDFYTSMKQMKLNSNPDTYRKRPYFASVEAMVAPDQQSELNAFEQRMIDVVSAELAQWGRYRNNTDTNINEYSTMYYDFIGFNFNNEMLAKFEAREAIAHAVNIPDMINDIYLGHASQAYTPINRDSWLFEPDVSQYAFDLILAENLLKNAGYSGASLRILVNAENDERVKIAGILKDNLGKIGVGATLESLVYDEYVRRLNEKDFDVFIGGFNLSAAPDLGFAFGSANGEENIFSYKNEAMNALLASAFTAAGGAAYQKAVSDLQKYIAKELPCVSLVFRKSAMLSDRKVLGDKHPIIFNIYSDINQWFFNR